MIVKNNFSAAWLPVLAVLLAACDTPNQSLAPSVAALPVHQVSAPAPADYWYQGKAELSVFEVEQERYGEMRKAEQVNVFVTEDFSRKKQVKLDDPTAAGADRVPILKLNAIRRFKTGIYDYSLMQSVFTPMNGGGALKTTLSVQDWCGQVFAQNNWLSEGRWNARLWSYFESEGDQEQVLKADLLEDEIWNRIRIQPDAIPTGEVKVAPAGVFLRFRHLPLQVAPATITQTEAGAGKRQLTLQYSNIPRRLVVTYENAAPWRITGWEETYQGKIMSRGVLKSVRQEAYWEQNSQRFVALRDSMSLRF